LSPAVETAGQPTRTPSGQSEVASLAGGTLPTSGFSMGDETKTRGPSGSVPTAPQTLHRHGLLQTFQSLVYTIVVALFIITFTVQPFRIPSESMVPTLLVGDFLLVN
jgi:hypothetical protein